MLPCLRHPFHRKCIYDFVWSGNQSNRQPRALKPSKCPYCQVDATGWLIIEISPPRPTLPTPNPEDIIQEVTYSNVNQLQGKFRPCCNSRFEELDGVVFPGPCFNHPMHERCYVIQRLGDFSAEAVAREVPCLSCGEILNNEARISMII
ncbi:hypothetical protein LIER_41187 [Lithospermum erythrorhizon]|uniref:RING-type domain-containing protein n=1 Tax=Lithospermum erythrorhizon TaxID=34254 RepID=A0AAV3R6Q9_LITER